MGDRASYAIREHGAIELRYAQFGAASLLADIFWGPDSLEALIRQQEPTREWLDDVWGEAAVAIDKHTHTIAFYDARYAEDTQQLAARLMRHTWPGWTVRAERYVSGVAAILGEDLSRLVVPPVQQRDLAWLELETDRPLGRSGILELVRGGVRDRRVVFGQFVELLWFGPRLLEAIPRMTPLADALAAIATLYDGDDPAPLLRGMTAPGVITIDADAQRIDATFVVEPTTLQSMAITRAAVASSWPGWTAVAHRGPLSAHFARHDSEAPDNLEPARPAPRTDDECVRELATGLFASEAHKEDAAAWLARVAGAHNVAAHPIASDARIAAFSAALTAALPGVDATAALAAARTAADAGWQRDSAALATGEWYPMDIVHGDGVVIALAKGRVRGKVQCPTLLRWLDPAQPPEVVCEIVDEDRSSLSRLSLAPSQHGCAVMLSTVSAEELYWIDFAAKVPTRIAQSSERARLVDVRFAWSPERDRLAFSVTDEHGHGRLGETVVIVYDIASGFVGEQANVAIARWDASGLVVRRGADEELFAATASAQVASARCGHAAGEDPAARELAREVEAAHLARRAKAQLADDAEAAATQALVALELDPASRLALEVAVDAYEALGDYDQLHAVATRATERTPGSAPAWRALARAAHARDDYGAMLIAAERAVAIAPFHAATYDTLATALLAASRVDDAIAACERAVLCQSSMREQLATDDTFTPLWGHAGWREFDYARLVRSGDAAEIAEAIALFPDRDAGYVALLETDADPLATTDAWRRERPDSLEAWLAHARAREGAAARTSCAELLARWPLHWGAHLELARLDVTAGDDASALAHLRRAQGVVAADEDAAADLFRAVEEDELVGKFLEPLYPSPDVNASCC